jgi:hypothetical protein
MGKSVESQLAFAAKKCSPIKSFFVTKIPTTSDPAPRSAKTQMAMTASTAYAAKSNKNTNISAHGESIEEAKLLITTRRSSPLSRLGGNDGSSPSGSLIVSSGTDSDTADSFAEQLRRASMYVNMDNNNGRIGDFEVFFLR